MQVLLAMRTVRFETGATRLQLEPIAHSESRFETSKGPPDMRHESAPLVQGRDPHPPKFGEIQKGTAGRGREKKASRQFATNVTTIYDMSRQFATFYDNFRLFIPLT